MGRLVFVNSKKIKIQKMKTKFCGEKFRNRKANLFKIQITKYR